MTFYSGEEVVGPEPRMPIAVGTTLNPVPASEANGGVRNSASDVAQQSGATPAQPTTTPTQEDFQKFQRAEQQAAERRIKEVEQKYQQQLSAVEQRLQEFETSQKSSKREIELTREFMRDYNLDSAEAREYARAKVQEEMALEQKDRKLSEYEQREQEATQLQAKADTVREALRETGITKKQLAEAAADIDINDPHFDRKIWAAANRVMRQSTAQTTTSQASKQLINSMGLPGQSAQTGTSSVPTDRPPHRRGRNPANLDWINANDPRYNKR